MPQISIYLSNRYDTDLVCLINRIGVKNFRKLTKAALLSLNHPEYIGKSKDYLIDGTDMPVVEKGCIMIILSFQDARYDFVKDLLTHIKDRKQSAFIKQVIRYYLGPLDILPSFFKEDITFPTKQLYTPLIINGVLNSAPKVRRQRQSYKKPKPIPVYETPHISKNTEVFKEADIEEIPATTEMESDSSIDKQDEILALLSNMLS